jgi:hypothetical protein
MQKQANFKFIDMSDSDSEGEDEKENYDSRSYTKMTDSVKGSHRPCTQVQGLRYNHSSIINQARSTPTAKDMQFSTLSLDEPSLEHHDDRLQAKVQEKSYLTR